MHPASSMPSIAATQAQQEHARREHKWRLAAHSGLSHKQENDQQHAQLTQWRTAAQQHSQGRIKVYAPDFIAQLQQDAQHRQQQLTQASFDALSPHSKKAAALRRQQQSPTGAAGRVVKKFGHARTASMVDLLFREAQAEAAGHKERLKENVQKNERRATESIRRDWDKLQQNNAGFVAEIRDYLALADEQKRHEREAFYQRWCREVFDPIQQQVAAHITQHDKELSAFRRALFAYYLASPTASLAFPLTCTTTATTTAAQPAQPTAPHLTGYRYATAAIDANDPTLHTLTRQQCDSALPGVPCTGPLGSTARVVFDARMWDKLEATPYGRYVGTESGMSEAERGVVERGVRQRMAEMGWDEYNVVNDSGKAYVQWFGERSGVRIVDKNKNRPFNIVSNHATAEQKN